MVGFVLNLASLWCNQSVSATTYAVVGAMNKIPLLLLGTVLFTSVITSQQWLYISASMVRAIEFPHHPRYKLISAIRVYSAALLYAVA